MRKDFDIVGSYDNQRVSTISAERTVNMFEYLDPDGKRPKSLLPTSGLQDSNLAFSGTVSTDGSRATFVYNNSVTGTQQIFQVFGDQVYLIQGSTGSLSDTRLGEINTTSGYVGISANQYQVIFVDGQNGWIYDINAQTFEQITDTGFPAKPIDVTYLDGFFIVANGDTNTFQLSSLNQGMVWSGGSAVAPNAVFITNIGVEPDILIFTGVSDADFATGVPVMLTTSGGGVLPTATPALTTTDTYYAIKVGTGINTPGRIKLARSYQDAIAGTAITLSADAVATTSIYLVGELQLGTMTSHPGTIVACRTLHRRLFLFSQNYTEVWENAGIGTTLPVRRNNSLLMEVGTPAIGSISVGFDRMFFLAQDKDGLAGVMEVKGTESVPVSNRALDYQLAQYAGDPDTGVADARGILVKENGIIFYRLNFTLANHTFVLNVTFSTVDAPKWHEEEVLNGDRHPAQTHAYFDGVNYYGDYDQPVFYICDNSIPDNAGEAIRRMRISRQYTPEGYNRLRIDRWQLDVLQGDADDEILDSAFLEAENNDDILTEAEQLLLLDQQVIVNSGQPVVFLSISKDGGQTYGYLMRGTMGKLGERTHRTVWRKLGTTPRGQGFIAKIEFYNKVPFVVLGAAWDFEILPE